MLGQHLMLNLCSRSSGQSRGEGTTSTTATHGWSLNSPRPFPRTIQESLCTGEGRGWLQLQQGAKAPSRRAYVEEQERGYTTHCNAASFRHPCMEIQEFSDTFLAPSLHLAPPPARFPPGWPQQTAREREDRASPLPPLIEIQRVMQTRGKNILHFLSLLPLYQLAQEILEQQSNPLGPAGI